jgi:hypothetical protein
MEATIEVNGVSNRFGPALGALVPAAGPLADWLAIQAARNLKTCRSGHGPVSARVPCGLPGPWATLR